MKDIARTEHDAVVLDQGAEIPYARSSDERRKVHRWLGKPCRVPMCFSVSLIGSDASNQHYLRDTCADRLKGDAPTDRLTAAAVD